MFRRGNRALPPKPPKTPMSELRECIQTLKDLISLTKEELKLTPITSRRNQRIENDAQFIHLSPDVEDHIVEVIRRISEIVVLGEQRAAAKLLGEDETADTSIENSSASVVQDNDVFEYFCEKNVIGDIINIATGAAFMDAPAHQNLPGDSLEFASSTDSVINGTSKERFIRPSDHPIQLPPLSITIQAIQSISILVQNVKMTTSLYLLLSNNKVNDLINLPLQLYSYAERHHQEDQSAASASERLRAGSMQDMVAESSELTNIFVAFLKSLAMKMNPETLQFYLTYPVQEPGSTKDIDFGDIQFPLYERALQFCNPDEDPFVRVTAMNLCLNTLRLATNGNSLGAPAFEDHQDGNFNSASDGKYGSVDIDDRPDMKKNPKATSSLPFRERLAVAHYVCAPSRVQSLCAGIFTRLATLCGNVEESIRSMERIDRGISARFVSIDNHRKSSSAAIDRTSTLIEEEKKEIEKLQSKRIKVVKHFLGDIVSDFQDEMFLLEDVLNVGLVPLNEQIIEMMFPTVIYPLVLTPLHNFIKRVSSGETSEVNPFGPKPLTKHFSRPLSRGGAITASECDSSLAKSALFVIASIYHFISHEEILHLLLTALLHPLAPDVTTATTVSQRTPDIVYEDENGTIHIKTDKLQEYSSSNFYKYGCSGGNGSSTNGGYRGDPRHDCIFVFAPILSEIFEWSVNGQTSKSPPENLTRNRYRRTLLSCLSGTDGMAELQSLAVYAIDAMVSTLGKDVLDNIIFGTKIHREIEFRSAAPLDEDGDESDESDTASAFSTSVASTVHSVSTSNHMLEFIACMSVSVIAATISFDGLWNLKYNPVAAHAIYGATMIDESVKDAAVKFIRHRRYQSGKFVSQTPTRLEKYANEEEKEIDADLKMDRVFFEAFCDGDTFVVENVMRKQGVDPSSVWDGPAFISVAKDGNMLDLAKQICQDISAKHIIGHDCEEAAYRCGANSALSHIQLDAFAKLLKNTRGAPTLSKQQKYLGVGIQAEWSQRSMESKKNGQRMLISPLSEKFFTLLFDDEISSTSISGGSVPKPGDVVKLVGRKPFPCVCEIDEGSESLVTNKDACVIADGVKWQSLYLVMLHKHMILTEPVKGDSGGYGRVVTCCPLSCLMAESYDNNDADQLSPPRRLLLTHFSPERQVPGLFVADNKIDSTGANDEVRISRSCLDIWFEDVNSGAKAHKALCHRIFKARTERGKQIREILPKS